MYAYFYNMCVCHYTYTYVCKSLHVKLCTIFVPQVVPEAAGVPILKHEFPVSDVPQRKTLHTSYM